MKNTVPALFLLLISSTCHAEWKPISKQDALHKKTPLTDKKNIPKNCLIDGEYYEFTGRVAHLTHKNMLFLSEDNSKPTCLYIKKGDKYLKQKATIALTLKGTKIGKSYKKATFKGKLSARQTNSITDGWHYMTLNVTSWELSK